MKKTVPASGSDDEAYMNSIMQETQVAEDRNTYQMDDGEHKKDEDSADDQKITNVLSHKEVDAKIGECDPPRIVREILHSRVVHLAHYECMPREEPKAGPRVDGLGIDRRIVARLQDDGIESFYSYQGEAIRRIMGGESVVIEAPTAFGKTEAFLVPIVQMCAGGNEGGVRALFVYPTKALGRDQHAKISRMAEAVGMRAAVFDGDTAASDRSQLAKNPPEIIITNFDLLHHQMFRNGTLPGMVRALKFLVVDETHSYAGVFGANAHHIIARLKRLTGSLQFVGASATLNGSREFCSSLFGQDVGVVRETGRRSTIDFAMLSPAVVKKKGMDRQLPKKEMMVNMAAKLSRGEHKTMIFSNSHYNAERIGMEAKQKKLRADIHRGGIKPASLKGVESKFRSGELNVISCTPTLELGIDIGSVDTVISETIPANRFMQRLGRAGRKGNRGCALLALGDDAISQYYRSHPGDYMLDEWIPHIDVENPDVLRIQTVAMACDRPLVAGEVSERSQAVGWCVKDGMLERVGQAFRATEKGISALRAYSIRGIGESIAIHTREGWAGERNLPVALSELHPGAVYILRGRRYRVGSLEYPAGMRAEIEPLGRGKKLETRAIGNGSAEVLGVLDRRRCRGVDVEFCSMRITSAVFGYYLVDVSGGEETIIAKNALNEPLTYSFETKGVRFRVPRPTGTIGTRSKAEAALTEAGTYHAAEHVMIDAGRMVTGASASDIGGVSDATGLVYVYDDAVGGSGVSRVMYGRMEEAVARAREIVAGCTCGSHEGCPQCTMSYRCRMNNEGLHKRGALEAFSRMAGGEITSMG